MSFPKYDDLFNPLLRALHELGGSASVSETEDKVAEVLNLSDREINEIHKGSRTKLNYRLAWARNYLKRYGLLENSAKGVWSLTPKGNITKTVNKHEVNRALKERDFINEDRNEIKAENVVSVSPLAWQDELLGVLKKLPPSEFEKLCQRILRESGFVQVKVTGKAGDGGIDGIGTVRLGSFLGFKVIFQCKRYKGSVASKEIREFKGTMAGRADRGLFITTGIFTKDAKTEATRDGSPPLDLVDGELLVEKMKELGLGVKVKLEEVIEVDNEWFKAF